MDVKFDAMPQAERAIVYVRPVRVAELPADVQAKIGGLETVYSVNRTDGERLALVADRMLAFSLARQHEMDPVSAH
jgi:hypothetical protein